MKSNIHKALEEALKQYNRYVVEDDKYVSKSHNDLKGIFLNFLKARLAEYTEYNRAKTNGLNIDMFSFQVIDRKIVAISFQIYTYSASDANRLCNLLNEVVKSIEVREISYESNVQYEDTIVTMNTLISSIRNFKIN